MADALNLSVRTVHLLAMVALVGGSAGAWYALHVGRVPASTLVRFECAFWGAMGVMVVTGVGNLGALGAPGPGTRWGAVLTVKLLAVLAVVGGSILRTLAVLRTDAADLRRTAHRRRVEAGYAATTGAFLVVVVLAEVLAHG